MDIRHQQLRQALELEIVSASALMEAKELLDREGSDYFRGFIEGYSHCLKLSELFDEISSEETYRNVVIQSKSCNER